MIIYKITNRINNKVYIGLTTTSLEDRWRRHLTEGRNINNKKHLYKSMRKHGLENFSIEQIDETDNFEELGKLERKYIELFESMNPNKGYNLTAGGEKNQFDGNSQAKLSIKDVVKIREMYKEKKLKIREVYEFYSDKLSFSGFQKIWLGESWKGIMDEVYTKENIDFHNKQKGKNGEDNCLAKYTNKEVLEIRKYYVNHTLKECFEKYGRKSKSILSFRNLIDSSYKNIPIYSKVKKKWQLNNNEIYLEEMNNEN